MNKISVSRFSERLNKSLFFFAAILLHLIIFLMVVGYVVWPEQKVVKDDAFQKGFVLPPPADQPKAPPNNQANLPNEPTITPTVIHGSDPVAPGFTPAQGAGEGLGIMPGDLGSHDPGLAAPLDHPLKSGSAVDIKEVAHAHEQWDPSHNGRMRFPIYLAKYADGDWDCNHYFQGDTLTSGCLPNLLAKVDEWSGGELKGKVIKAVALDSAELIDNPPPFLFFTGHKNFILTDAEIANLRKYLQNGGAIWGDSAYSGDGSRFDVAFHREMKRVLPDKDKNFEPLPEDHPIFTQGKFHLEGLPSGMNYHSDPIECINLGGKLAVIYTPNDYSDMMTMHLLPGRDERSAAVAPGDHWTQEQPLFTPGNFNYHHVAFYRNYEPASAMTSYKLSMNILVHLLHRYDDELQDMTP